MTEPSVVFRCSSIARIMSEPRSLKEGPLSQGARTYIRQLATEALFGVELEFTSKETSKGLIVEPDSIALYNRINGTNLVKNTERRTQDWISGEPDLIHEGVRGIDIKSSWSIKTFPWHQSDCIEPLYEWQARGYSLLWDLPEWHIAYCLVNTPDDLLKYEQQPALHYVDHIPERHRLTTWVIKRDLVKEAVMIEKVKHARAYYAQVIAEFDKTHALA